MEIENDREKTDWLKYFYTFVITALIFATAIYISDYFSNKKITQLKTMGDKISLDILSSETQFSLLTESSCENIDDNTVFILYFYSNKGSCTDCQNEGYVLTKLHELYPQIRIYSFDYDFNIPTIETLKSMYSIENKLPALFINGKVQYGLKTIDDIKKIIPQTKIWDKEALASSTESNI